MLHTHGYGMTTYVHTRLPTFLMSSLLAASVQQCGARVCIVCDVPLHIFLPLVHV